MPRIRSESWGAADLSWLASSHALWNGRTESLNVAAFTAGTHYPDGFLPSGTPVALVGGLLVPYDKTEATVTGAGVLAGHLLNAIPLPAGTTGNIGGVAVLDHGRVKAARVPHAFVAPVAEAKRARVNLIYV